MGDERRNAARHRVFIPIRMDGRLDAQVGKVTSGITRDVSEQGLLVRTRRQFTVGASVTVAVQVDPAGPVRELPGTVVRMGSNVADPGGLWPFEVAIRLDQAEPALQAAAANGFVDDG
ncbi:MAG: PilZ domain-containing protein [Myxococcota bacterium]